MTLRDIMDKSPTSFSNLCLNPRSRTAPKNPLCPVCESEIVPVENEVQRKFICECEELWRFEFMKAEERGKLFWKDGYSFDLEKI